MSRKHFRQLPAKCRPIRKNSNRTLTAYLFLTPSLLGVLLFSACPFIDVFRRAHLDALGAHFVGIENFITVIHNDAFRLAMKNTLYFMLFCIPLLLGISLSIALGFVYVHQGVIGKRTTSFCKGCKMGYLLPYALPVSSIVILWRLLFHAKGLVNSYLVPEAFWSDWMHTKYAFLILCLCYLWKNMGFYLILWLTAIQEIGEAVMKAGKMDGATFFQSVRFLIMPQLKKTLHMLFILALLACFRSYREAYLVAGDYPDRSMYLLQHVFNNWFAMLDVAKMSAGAVILVMILTVLVILLYGRGNDT